MSLTRTLTYRKRAVKLVDWKTEPNSAGELLMLRVQIVSNLGPWEGIST